MKKIVFLLFATAVFFTACTGDQGPAGPPGKDGGIFVSSAFEIRIDFNTANDFSHTENYGFKVYPSDVTLVYILWDVYNGNEIWRLLPQSVRFDEGELIYNFDFTQADVSIFLDGTIDLTTLDAKWTQNQLFRVVVLPADNIDAMNIDNLFEVMQASNIKSFEVK